MHCANCFEFIELDEATAKYKHIITPENEGDFLVDEFHCPGTWGCGPNGLKATKRQDIGHISPWFVLTKGEKSVE